jgi:hypothetical protein
MTPVYCNDTPFDPAGPSACMPLHFVHAPYLGAQALHEFLTFTTS